MRGNCSGPKSNSASKKTIAVSDGLSMCLGRAPFVLAQIFGHRASSSSRIRLSHPFQRTRRSVEDYLHKRPTRRGGRVDYDAQENLVALRSPSRFLRDVGPAPPVESIVL